MKDADKMAKLLEAAKIVLEEDIIPSLPSRKRLSALLVEEALSIALNTCLLYTSPSPRDSIASRMPSSA